MKKLFLILLLLVPLIAFGQYKTKSGINQGDGFQFKSGYVFSPESLQYFARYPVPPATDTMKIYAEFIDSLVLNGAWNKLCVLVWTANRDTTSALLNMKGTSFTGISIGGPAFVPYRGFTTGTNKYINAQFNPSTAGSIYTKDSASFGVYSNTDYLISSNLAGLQIGGYWSLINPLHSKGYWNCINSSNFMTPANEHTVGLFSVIRRASNLSVSYIDSDSAGSSAVASVTLANDNFYIGCTNNGSPAGFSERQIAYYYFGTLLTAQDIWNINSCAARCLVKLGANTMIKIVCDGNSMTGYSPNYPTKLRDTLSGSLYKVVNRSVQSQTITDMNTLYPTRMAHRPTDKTNVLIYWEGTNLIRVSNKIFADSVYNELKRYGLQARATNKWSKIIVMTVLPFDTSTSRNLTRDTVNSLLIAHYSEFADTIINLCDNENIGQWGDQLNTDLYSDKLHLTDAGQAIVMRMVYVALKNLKVVQ